MCKLIIILTTGIVTVEGTVIQVYAHMNGIKETYNSFVAAYLYAANGVLTETVSKGI